MAERRISACNPVFKRPSDLSQPARQWVPSGTNLGHQTFVSGLDSPENQSEEPIEKSLKLAPMIARGGSRACRDRGGTGSPTPLQPWRERTLQRWHQARLGLSRRPRLRQTWCTIQHILDQEAATWNVSQFEAPTSRQGRSVASGDIARTRGPGTTGAWSPRERPRDTGFAETCAKLRHSRARTLVCQRQRW